MLRVALGSNGKRVSPSSRSFPFHSERACVLVPRSFADPNRACFGSVGNERYRRESFRSERRSSFGAFLPSKGRAIRARPTRSKRSFRNEDVRDVQDRFGKRPAPLEPRDEAHACSSLVLQASGTQVLAGFQGKERSCLRFRKFLPRRRRSERFGRQAIRSLGRSCFEPWRTRTLPVVRERFDG